MLFRSLGLVEAREVHELHEDHCYHSLGACQCIETALYLCREEGQLHSEVYEQAGSQQFEGDSYSPLVSTCETLSGVPSPVMGSPGQKTTTVF